MARNFVAPRPPGWTTDAELGQFLVFNLGTGAIAVATTAGAIQVVNDFGTDMVIIGARAKVTTAPTGAAAIFDVKVAGTTIYTTTANRPTIAISGTDSGTPATPDVTAWNVGQTLTFDIVQVGSVVAGSGLCLTVLVRSA